MSPGPDPPLSPVYSRRYKHIPGVTVSGGNGIAKVQIYHLLHFHYPFSKTSRAPRIWILSESHDSLFSSTWFLGKFHRLQGIKRGTQRFHLEIHILEEQEYLLFHSLLCPQCLEAYRARGGCCLPINYRHEWTIQTNSTDCLHFEHKNQIYVILLTELVVLFGCFFV